MQNCKLITDRGLQVLSNFCDNLSELNLGYEDMCGVGVMGGMNALCGTRTMRLLVYLDTNSFDCVCCAWFFLNIKTSHGQK
jgi:hypothetical protein